MAAYISNMKLPGLICFSQLSAFVFSLQAENILILDMDLPTRTTKDYQEPVIAPTVAAALEEALRDEDEIEIDASGFNSSLRPTPSASASSSFKKPKSG